MTNVEAIENQIQHLDNSSFAALRAFFSIVDTCAGIAKLHPIPIRVC